ncbi:MAG: 2-amino-4-hydroxy-6-hydroxymethyldihydropteridine diphosphokinase [bacterium]|nr:2-amino-4-hydroxy-6-hydroxymethyldihydropteridine diphosphokinase [bacterium]
MIRAAIGLGSNLGNRARHIGDAVGALSGLGSLVAVSSLYETAPVGGPEQGPYINAVAILDTDLPVRELLKRCLEIEKEHGRERRERWGPRTLDLDVLLYGEQIVAVPDLTVPHPRIAERRFVLEPLLEIWPDAVLPDGTPISGFRAGVADQEVHKLDTVVPDRRISVAVLVVVTLAVLVIWWLGDLLL